ncbi:MAG: phytanoyl-CoA dioxygenase family protein [Planctomycetota bacterium]
MSTTSQASPALRVHDEVVDSEDFLHRRGDRRYERRCVSADEYRHFRQWGYVIVRGLISPEDVDELDQHTMDLMQGRLPEQQAMDEFDPDRLEHENYRERLRGEGKTTRHLVRPPEDATPEEKAAIFLRIHMLHRQLALHEQYLLHPRILDVLEAIIGPDVLALQSMLFLKPPGKVGQGWHQDSYYIPTQPDTLIGSWLAIDDADELNGALWLAKGSGREPIYPPCPNVADGTKPYGFGDRLIEDLTHIHGASDPQDDHNHLTPVADGYDQVLASVKKGDVVFFNGHILHRSKDNITKDRYRRAFVGHYCNARSITQWGYDPEGGPIARDESLGGATNGSHILARGDTHLPFARPRFDTPCAALLPDEVRRGHFDGIARTLAAHGDGMMGCGIGVPDDHD